MRKDVLEIELVFYPLFLLFLIAALCGVPASLCVSLCISVNFLSAWYFPLLGGLMITSFISSAYHTVILFLRERIFFMVACHFAEFKLAFYLCES